MYTIQIMFGCLYPPSHIYREVCVWVHANLVPSACEWAWMGASERYLLCIAKTVSIGNTLIQLVQKVFEALRISFRIISLARKSTHTHTHPSKNLHLSATLPNYDFIEWGLFHACYCCCLCRKCKQNRKIYAFSYATGAPEKKEWEPSTRVKIK